MVSKIDKNSIFSLCNVKGNDSRSAIKSCYFLFTFDDQSPLSGVLKHVNVRPKSINVERPSWLRNKHANNVPTELVGNVE